MKILNSPIETLTFEDVALFCKEGFPEGVQVDYKKEFPKNGFAKHLAAFSNMRGGVIIIGVEEDKKTGLPVAWKGVSEDAKQIEKIHQMACNVDPIPSYKVCATDKVDGKYFVLIRINEGDEAPYYVQNDSNVWVRTGNVSNSINIASPNELELLFGKKKKAEKARNLYLKMAEEVYENALKREEENRKRQIELAKRKGDGSEKAIYSNVLGSDASLCRISVQPHFPAEALLKPQEIKENLHEIQFNSHGYMFPQDHMLPNPQGLFFFGQDYDGRIECQQIYGQGLIHLVYDVREEDESGRKFVPCWRIALKLFEMLQFAKSFYAKSGYQGGLDGFISLDNMENVYIDKLKVRHGFSFDNDDKSLLPYYKLDIRIDTNILKNEDSLKKWYVDTLRELHWYFGYDNIQDSAVDSFLREAGFSFEKQGKQ